MLTADTARGQRNPNSSRQCHTLVAVQRNFYRASENSAALPAARILPQATVREQRSEASDIYRVVLELLVIPCAAVILCNAMRGNREAARTMWRIITVRSFDSCAGLIPVQSPLASFPYSGSINRADHNIICRRSRHQQCRASSTRNANRSRQFCSFSFHGPRLRDLKFVAYDILKSLYGKVIQHGGAESRAVDPFHCQPGIDRRGHGNGAL
jgi:hypothetical protein